MINRLYTSSPLMWISGLILLWAGWVFYFYSAPFQNNISQFFPTQQSIEAQYLKHQLAQNQTSSWLLLAINSSKKSQNLAELSHSVQHQLTSLPGVKQVLNGSQTFQSPLQSNPIPKLYKYRYLTTEFKASEIKSNIHKRWQEYQLGFVLDKHWLLDDPTYQWGVYQKQLKPSTQLAKVDGVWTGPQHQKALLLIETDKNPQLLNAINTQLENLVGNNHFQLSGSDWIALQAEQQIKQSVNWITLFAIGMVLLALFIAFRSFKLIFYSSLPLIAAFAVGVLSTITLFGSMQLITLALGAILLGVAIDYPIHTISAYQSRKKSVVLRLWPTVRLGGLTSAFGFLMLWWTGIEGLQQMAVFASAGLLTALWVTHVLKPYLAMCFTLPTSTDNEVYETHTETNNKEIKNKETKNRHAFFYVLAGLVIITFVLLFKPLQWQDDIASLSPVSKELISTDQRLRTLFQYQEVGKKLLLPAKDIESLLQKEESLIKSLTQLTEEGVIQQYQLLAQVLPSQLMQTKRQQALPTESTLLNALNQSVQGTKFTAKHFAPFIKSMQQSKQLPLLTFDKFIQLNSSSKQLANQLVMPSSGQFIGVINLSGVVSDKALKELANQHKDIGLIYFNQRALVASQIAQIRFRMLQILGIILVVIGFGVWLKYRQLKAVLTVLSPVVIAVGFTLVTFSLLNISLSIFHLMSLMLVAAIGIDYSLLFYEGTMQKEDAKEWNRSVLIAFFTTIGSFSILSFSQLALLNAIGLTVLVGVLWVYSLAFLMSKSRVAVSKNK